MIQVLFFIIALIPFCTMKAQETAKIKITVGITSFVASTYDNETAKAFWALLPMTIDMTELNGNEKYHYLSGNLPNSTTNPDIITAGDIMLWGQNCVVLFYETFSTSYSYTKIGTVDNPARLKEALGRGNVTVKFELVTATGMKVPEKNALEYYISYDKIIHVNGNITAISLIEMNGRTLKSSTSDTIDVNGLPTGIYMLLVEKWHETNTVKIKI